MADMSRTRVSVPVGILERAAWYADEYASQWDGDPNVDLDTQKVIDSAYNLARALYAAARGESVNWHKL